jgi:EAL domain-containing protein (putative c-di-GMP-specific phosphodiesterase class I)
MKLTFSAKRPLRFRPVVDTFQHRALGLCFLDLRDAKAILNSGMKPGNVIFELNEQDLARAPVRLRRMYQKSRERGFGTAQTGLGISAGGSSIRLVRELLPDYIRLDERLIRNLHQSMCASMVSRMVILADELGVRLVADGVARQSAVENLWLLGVQFMQGAVFSKRAPPAARRYTRICHSRSTSRSLTSKA